MKQDRTNTPPSDVYLDGEKLAYVLWADIDRKKVCVAIQPLRAHKHGKRVLSKILRGHVEIVPWSIKRVAVMKEGTTPC